MQLSKSGKTSVFCALLILATQTACAVSDPTHLGEAAQKSSALQKSYQQLTAPLLDAAPWLANYGTTAPASAASLDNTDYLIYWGCKPHDCISQSYALLYDIKQDKLVAGAFVDNQSAGPNMDTSSITWLGQTSFDQARILAQHLF